MQDTSIIVRVFDANTQSYGLNKLLGNIALSSVADLISVADLEANPRQAKRNNVTTEIEDSLDNEGDIFHFLTKGILIGARRVEALERNRFRITFEDRQLEGILDGGHNIFADGRHILRLLLENGEAVVRGIRNWEELKAAWEKYEAEIEEKKGDLPDIRIPIEIVYPAEGDGAEEFFQEKILRINAARNNNAQLTEGTKANKRGAYDEIKANLDSVIEGDVEWKLNAGGRLKSRDLVALSLIPLSLLADELPTGQIRDYPPVVFSQKEQCVKIYNELLDKPGVAEPVKGDIIQIIHPGVKSALALMRDLPRLYDLIYELLPEAYNSVSSRFGGMNCVRMWRGEERYRENKKKYLAKPARTKFYQNPVEYDYPDGFVLPIVFALTALMEVKDGLVSWKVMPDPFIRNNMERVMQTYWTIIQGQNYDPAKVGKAKGAYALVRTLFESALNEEYIARLRESGRL